MVKILWVDDEVELLKPHVLFLRQKGYEVDTCNNGYDAIDMASEGAYDLIILDEMMPGMTGLETLPKIKEVRPTTPVIMVTKSEEENIMDKAVGSKIADYLIKPVNPNQVLLSIKKNVHQQQLVTEQTTADYRSEFGRISSSLQMADTFQDWCALYRKLTAWEVELAESTDQSIKEVLTYQKSEANQEFCKFVRRNYYNWINKRSDDTPVMSHTLMRTNIFPVADENPKTTLLLIDNFRYDQWRSISSLLRGWYDVAQDDFYCAILPHGHAVRPQRRLRGADAAGHRQADAQQVAQRQRGGRQKPVRGGVFEAADEPERQVVEVFVRQTGAPGAGPQAGGQHPEGLRRRLLGHRLQLPRHPLARTYRDRHHPRTHGGRRGVPLADALVVRAFRTSTPSSSSSPSGDTPSSSPRTTARSAWTTR